MEAVRHYLLGVISTAIICTIAQHLIRGKGPGNAIVKLISGVVMALAVISPLGAIRLSNLNDWSELYKEQAEIVVMEGQEYSYAALNKVIKDRLETYILDEARTLNSEIKVEIQLTEDAIPMPCSVEIQGRVSPFVKNKLSALIESDIGIGKENQNWI